jgi:isocitrate/isopropylmalate dehydrogenase
MLSWPSIGVRVHRRLFDFTAAWSGSIVLRRGAQIWILHKKSQSMLRLVHSSAPYIAGQSIANPVWVFCCAAEIEGRWLEGEDEEAAIALVP